MRLGPDVVLGLVPCHPRTREGRDVREGRRRSGGRSAAWVPPCEEPTPAAGPPGRTALDRASPSRVGVDRPRDDQLVRVPGSAPHTGRDAPPRWPPRHHGSGCAGSSARSLPPRTRPCASVPLALWTVTSWTRSGSPAASSARRRPDRACTCRGSLRVTDVGRQGGRGVRGPRPVAASGRSGRRADRGQRADRGVEDSGRSSRRRRTSMTGRKGSSRLRTCRPASMASASSRGPPWRRWRGGRLTSPTPRQRRRYLDQARSSCVWSADARARRCP